MSQSQYLSATGRIRSLETKLLSAADIERMIDAKDALGAFKVLNDLSYADEAAEVKDPGEYDSILKHDLVQVKELMRQVVVEPALLNLLFMENDFHNIKLFFKAKMLSKNLNKHESQVGNIEASSLREYIVDGSNVSLPEDFKKIIDEASEYFETLGSIDGFLIDSWLDHKFYSLALELTQDLGYKFIVELVESWAARANIKCLLRAKKMKLEWSELEKYLLKNNLDISRIKSLYEGNFSDLAAGIVASVKSASLRANIKDWAENDEFPLWKLDKIFDNYEMELIKSSRYIAYGPEVVVAYFMAKKSAMRNIRLIFTGKLNDLPNEEIKERVRDIY